MVIFGLFERLAAAAEDIPRDGKPHQFWFLAVSPGTLRNYVDLVRSGMDGFASSPPRLFMGFEVVADEDMPDGKVEARLK